MKKKIISWLSYMTVLVFLLQSCRHDELTNPENSSPNGSSLAAKYASKSPWKEDEVYIDKVQQVFLKHANLEYVRSRYGELNWNYAMSFGQFGERYALVPVIKNDKVVLLMEAVRKGSKVYFYEKEDPELMNFFNTVIFSAITGFDETINSSSKGLSYLCSKRTVTVGCLDGVPDCTPMNITSTVCEWVFTPGTPPKGFDPIGDPDAGGGGGYEYPIPPDEEYMDPCEKIKTQNTDTVYKEKLKFLKDKTSATYESGFRVGNPATGSGQSEPQYQQLNNTTGNTTLEFKIFNNTFGFMHSHYEGLIPIFSPDDINNFIKMLINASNNNIPLDTVFMTLVNPDGTTYQLWGSNDINVNNLSIFDQTVINDDLNTAYKKDYALENPNQSSQSYQEKFLKFMKEKMNVDGSKFYSIDDSGNASQISISQGSLDFPIPCPN